MHVARGHPLLPPLLPVALPAAHLPPSHPLPLAPGVDGVMSAESLLGDPALFSARRLQQPFGPLDGPHLLLEYCDLVDLYHTPWRMVKGHAFKLLGAWAWVGGEEGCWRLAARPLAARPCTPTHPTPPLAPHPGPSTPLSHPLTQQAPG